MIGPLIRKELHLQKSNGLFALVVLLFWVALMGAAPWGDVRVESLYRVQVAELIMFVQVGLVGMCLAFVLPMAIGASLAAEERNLGVWDWTLSLPGSRARQWAVKTGVGLALTALLAALPDFAWEKAPYGLSGELRKGAGLVFVPLLCFAAGAFASTLVSRSYQAFFLAIPVVAVAVGAGRLGDPFGMLFTIPWRYEKLVEVGLNGMARFYGILHIVAMAGLLIWLGYLNFRFDHFGKRRLVFQLVALVVGTAVVCDVLLRLAISPLPLVTNRWDELAPRIACSREQIWGDGRTPFDRERIQPLLVARRNPPWWSGGVSLAWGLGYGMTMSLDPRNPNVRYVALRHRGGTGQTLRLDVPTGDIGWSIVSRPGSPAVTSKDGQSLYTFLNGWWTARKAKSKPQNRRKPVWVESFDVQTDSGKTLHVKRAGLVSELGNLYIGQLDPCLSEARERLSSSVSRDVAQGNSGANRNASALSVSWPCLLLHDSSRAGRPTVCRLLRRLDHDPRRSCWGA